MSGAKVGDGRIPIELDNKQFYLVPSLEACIEISAMGGGLNGAVARCSQMNFDTICGIIGAGLEVDGRRLNPGQRDKFVPKAVYEAGLFGLSATCIEFCRIIANGGRPPEDEDEDEPEAAEGEEAPLG